MKIVAKKVIQNNSELYTTGIKFKDLVKEDLFKVDYWDPNLEDKMENGYQRRPTRAHVKAIAKYLGESIHNTDYVIPTAALLNSRTNFDQIKELGGGYYEVHLNHPIYIVDGQHRIAGARAAIDELKIQEVEEYELPVVISRFDRAEEIKQFRDINSTQKRVATDLSLQLLKDLYITHSRSNVSEKELKQLKALNIMKAMTHDSANVWYRKIQLPGEQWLPKHIARQTSFVSSMNPLMRGILGNEKHKLDDSIQVVSNYWQVLRELMPEAFASPRSYIIQKSPGMFSLHLVLAKILQIHPNPSKDDLKVLLTSMMKEMGMTYDYWRADKKTEGAAVYGSMKGFATLASIMYASIEMDSI